MSSLLANSSQPFGAWLAAGGHRAAPEGWAKYSLGELRAALGRPGGWRLCRAFAEARLAVADLECVRRPLLSALAARAVSRGRCALVDDRGAELVIDSARLLHFAARFVCDRLAAPRRLRHVRRDVARRHSTLATASPASRFERARPVLYLRTDLVYGLAAGGSVGHIAGVAGALDRFTGPVRFASTDDIPTLRDDIERIRLRPDNAFWDMAELPSLHSTEAFAQQALAAVADRALGMVYQRYSVNNYSGAVVAAARGAPLVLEYNGSEPWLHRHWGRPLRHERLSFAIETLNLAAARLVVVVSQPMADELAERGVSREKILVNPNGVDVERYRPDVSGHAVTESLGFAGKTVIGFIGTFGPWHGAEVLCQAFARLLARRTELRASTRLLMVGDGARRAAAEQIVDEAQLADCCVFTGTVPQAEGPRYLAACDVLVSPQTPNADGSPFFGSPTKLFEYLAMGRAVVASRLAQLAEIVVDGRSGLLADPGDAEHLSHVLERLIDDRELRQRLGRAAREQAVARHTWHEHTRRIVVALEEQAA